MTDKATNKKNTEAITKYGDTIYDVARRTFNDPSNKDKFTSEEQIVSVLALGNELGLKPEMSLLLHKELDRDSIFKVLTGRSIGLDPITSLRNIYPIETGNGIIYMVGVHIITAQLIKGGVKVDIVEDSQAAFKFTDINGVRFNEEDIDDRYFQVVSELQMMKTYRYIKKSEYDISPESFTAKYGKDLATNVSKVDLDKLDMTGIDLNRTQVMREAHPYTKRTKIKFTRPSTNNTITVSYTWAQAQLAGLLASSDASGQVIKKGKSNWNNNPETMCRNRCLAIGGRIIASDLMNGLYVEAEIIEDNVVQDIEEGDITFIEAEEEQKS